jgi:hypothetical protein
VDVSAQVASGQSKSLDSSYGSTGQTPTVFGSGEQLTLAGVTSTTTIERDLSFQHVIFNHSLFELSILFLSLNGNLNAETISYTFL